MKILIKLKLLTVLKTATFDLLSNIIKFDQVTDKQVIDIIEI